MSQVTPVVVLYAADEDAAGGHWSPGRDFLVDWASRALAAVDADRGEATTLSHELSVRLVAEETMRALNRRWRGRDRPTNVLSFPAALPPLDAALAAGEAAGEGMRRALGDLVLCPAVVSREAVAQGKRVGDHWAHLVVHGTLHLLGQDHVDAEAAEAMERLEIRILSEHGIPDPYGAQAPTSDV